MSIIYKSNKSYITKKKSYFLGKFLRNFALPKISIATVSIFCSQNIPILLFGSKYSQRSIPTTESVSFTL